MLRIYICEEHPQIQECISEIITKAICIEEYDMTLTLVTNDPHKLLETVAKLPCAAVYFLDAELKKDIDGMELASKIRMLDPRGFIIFIAAHEDIYSQDMYSLSFKHKLEVMDYINKNDPCQTMTDHIRACLKRANELYTAPTNTFHKLFRFKAGRQLITIPMDTVLYFKASSSSHRVAAHTLYQTTEFYGAIRKLAEQADERFLLTHRSCLVNRDFIFSVDCATLQIRLVNGDICPVSARQLRLFKTLS